MNHRSQEFLIDNEMGVVTPAEALAAWEINDGPTGSDR